MIPLEPYTGMSPETLLASGNPFQYENGASFPIVKSCMISNSREVIPDFRHQPLPFRKGFF